MFRPNQLRISPGDGGALKLSYLPVWLSVRIYSRPLLAMEKRKPKRCAYLDPCCMPFDAGSPSRFASRTASGILHSLRR